MNKVILFDLDGTLTDSGEGIINCALPVFTHFHLPIPSEKDLRTFIGPPLHETFLRYGISSEQVNDALQIFRSRYNTIGKFENTPYPGIRELLQTLRAQGHTLFVATSKPENMAVEILEHFDLAQYFQGICGASLDLSRTTKEAVIAYLLERNQNKDPMVMVGDTRFDVLGANLHGIPTIGVAWGYGEVAEMESAGAIAVAETTGQLLDLLNRDLKELSLSKG